MNFFGHAAAARRLGAGPATVLGAMLPDLAVMSGLGLRSCADGAVAAGIDLHHRCDAVFHREPAFLELLTRGRRRLETLGVRPAPARAVAHVGIELLCDGVLGDDAVALAAYRRALVEPAAPRVAAALSWDAEALGRFEALRERLVVASLPAAYRDPRATSLRLERILRRRPRLALHPEEVERVASWLGEIAPEVGGAAGSLLERTLAGVRADLGPLRRS